jgi:hypothetical protein
VQVTTQRTSRPITAGTSVITQSRRARAAAYVSCLEVFGIVSKRLLWWFQPVHTIGVDHRQSPPALLHAWSVGLLESTCMHAHGVVTMGWEPPGQLQLLGGHEDCSQTGHPRQAAAAAPVLLDGPQKEPAAVGWYPRGPPQLPHPVLRCQHLQALPRAPATMSWHLQQRQQLLLHAGLPPAAAGGVEPCGCLSPVRCHSTRRPARHPLHC